MIKHLDHLNMSVANLDETTKWYAELFDFSVQESGTYKGAPWNILRSGEALLCLYEHPDYDAPGSGRAHGLSHFGLRVADKSAFTARARAMGVALEYGGEVSWRHSSAFYVVDPTGYEIEVAAWHDDEVRFD